METHPFPDEKYKETAEVVMPELFPNIVRFDELMRTMSLLRYTQNLRGQHTKEELEKLREPELKAINTTLMNILEFEGEQYSRMMDMMQDSKIPDREELLNMEAVFSTKLQRVKRSFAPLVENFEGVEQYWKHDTKAQRSLEIKDDKAFATAEARFLAYRDKKIIQAHEANKKASYYDLVLYGGDWGPDSPLVAESELDVKTDSSGCEACHRLRRAQALFLQAHENGKTCNLLQADQTSPSFGAEVAPTPISVSQPTVPNPMPIRPRVPTIERPAPSATEGTFKMYCHTCQSTTHSDKHCFVVDVPTENPSSFQGQREVLIRKPNIIPVIADHQDKSANRSGFARPVK